MRLAEDYASKSTAYYGFARTEVLPYLPRDLKVVADIGGSSGATLSAIKTFMPSVTTVCVDSHPPALELARQSGHLPVQCDLEREQPCIPPNCDTVLFLDVLEHLTDPWRVLESVVRRLPDGATVIVSLPNVRYWGVSLALLFRGRWQLRDAGVLDRTHLRFFTRDSGAELVRGAGLRLRLVRGILSGGRSNALMDRVTLGAIRQFLCPQYLYVCIKE